MSADFVVRKSLVWPRWRARQDLTAAAAQAAGRLPSLGLHHEAKVREAEAWLRGRRVEDCPILVAVAAASNRTRDDLAQEWLAVDLACRSALAEIEADLAATGAAIDAAPTAAVIQGKAAEAKLRIDAKGNKPPRPPKSKPRP